jgi:hypothetical protein
VSFSETLIVALEICETAAIDQDIALIEESFVSTYKALVMEYCDPDFRFLETARVIEQGAFSPGILPVDLEVTGKCRGCDPDKTSIYDFPSAVTASSSMLMAMRTTPPCVESVGASHFGSTFESTLLLSFENDTDTEALDEQIEEAGSCQR